MTTAGFSSKQKFFYLLSAVLALTLILLGAGRVTKLITGANERKVPVSVLVREFQRIPVLPGSVRTRGITKFDKEIITGVNEVMGSSLAPDDVISYYLKESPGQGWSIFSNEEKRDGRKVKFCKDGMSFIVDASSGEFGTEYYLGVAWAKHSASSAYCPGEM